MHPYTDLVCSMNLFFRPSFGYNVIIHHHQEISTVFSVFQQIILLLLICIKYCCVFTLRAISNSIQLLLVFQINEY